MFILSDPVAVCVLADIAILYFQNLELFRNVMRLS